MLKFDERVVDFRNLQPAVCGLFYLDKLSRFFLSLLLLSLFLVHFGFVLNTLYTDSVNMGAFSQSTLVLQHWENVERGAQLFFNSYFYPRKLGELEADRIASHLLFVFIPAMHTLRTGVGFLSFFPPRSE